MKYFEKPVFQKIVLPDDIIATSSELKTVSCDYVCKSYNANTNYCAINCKGTSILTGQDRDESICWLRFSCELV